MGDDKSDLTKAGISPFDYDGMFELISPATSRE